VVLVHSTGFEGSNPALTPLDTPSTGHQHIPHWRKFGILATYLAPLATTNFRVTYMGGMTGGTATDRNFQTFRVGLPGVTARITGWTV
jgi:hypothetical protein